MRGGSLDRTIRGPFPTGGAHAFYTRPMRREVVISGVGAVSAAGVGAQAAWEALESGGPAIRPLTLFDPSGFATRLAGEIPELKARDFVPKSYRKATKIMARDSEIAVIAAQLALADAGLASRGSGETASSATPEGTPAIVPDRTGCQIGAGLLSAEINELTAALATSTDDAGVIIDALKKAFPNIQSPPSDDICYATTNRQHAVRQLAPRADLVLVVGSTHSSNSVRLTEIAANAGTPGKLLDDAAGLDESWLRKDDGSLIDAVLVTAGASAPEDLVADLCKTLVERFGAQIEVADIFEEDVEFGIPGTLKRAMRDKGIDPADRRIRVHAPEITAELYGAVPLTVSVDGCS